MKKIILILCMGLLFSGCTNSSNTDDTAERMNRYEAYYNSVLDNERFVESTDFFDVEVVMNILADGSYRYDIIIDNPRIAMYDVQAIVVENDTVFAQMEGMSASFGIFNSGDYVMIPNQVNRELGYIKGIDLSGTVDQPSVDLKMVVLWRDSGRINQQRVYMQLKGVYGQVEPENSSSEEYSSADEENLEENE